MMWEDQVASAIQRKLSAARAPLQIVLWNGRAVTGSPATGGAQPNVRVRLRRRSSALDVLRGDLGALAEGYVEGRFEIDGPLQPAVDAASALCGKSRLQWRPRWLRTHTKSADQRAVAFHYDVSNEFYALWLDRSLVYSCAYFRSGQEDVHQAQEQKLDYICRKLQLKPGEYFLDVGAGWGALVRHAVRHYGVRALGITISPSQLRYAQARNESEGLAGRCEMRLLDYRDLPREQVFDKIASIGMVEHVGLERLDTYFHALSRCLKDGGLLLNHGIASSHPDHKEVGLGGGRFIQRFVFPGTDLPHVGAAATAMSRRGFEAVDVEGLRPHYAKTLECWLSRLEAAREQAIELVGERRYKTWQIYMAGSAHAFKHGWISVYQTLALKNAGVNALAQPLTREHLYRPSTSSDLDGRPEKLFDAQRHERHRASYYVD